MFPPSAGSCRPPVATQASGGVSFLAQQIFGRWDLILYYDLARGLRAFAGSDAPRLKEMVVLANRKVGDLATARRDPAMAFALIDRFVQNNIMAAEGDRVSAAVIIDHASFLLPAGEPGRLSIPAATQVVTLLNWAASPHLKRLNMAFLIIDEKLSSINERITTSPHAAAIEIPIPDEATRARFAPALAAQTAGLTLLDLRGLLESKEPLDPKRLRGSGAANDHDGGSAEIKTAMPGKVVRILVAEGDAVQKGDGVIVIEAMKMQNEMKAPKDGTVRQIKVATGDTVSAGDILVVIEQ